SMSSLALFCRLRPASVAGWLDRAVRHPGAALRVKLRCGAAPVMQTVGAAAGIPREQRTCRICGSGAVESAEHFAAECPVYAAERAECLQRLDDQLAGARSPFLRRAIADGDVTS